MIPAGTFLSINTAAANRDPDVYQDPDRLDMTREGAAPMQTFGAGAHSCLGTSLARREIAQALVIMSRRMDNLHRVGPRAPWKPMVGISGPTALPVEFDAR
jgi:cytochrome P450